MVVTRTLQIVVGVVGLAALVLGLLFWIVNINLISIHMLFGFIVALGLLIMSIIALTGRGMRMWGSVGIVYALIIPIFGLSQERLLVGDLHWLIQVLHMLVGIGAMFLTGAMGARYMALRRVPADSTTQPQTVR